MSNFIRVLRNTDLCATREAAITKLEGKLATLQDGEICIASYGATWDAAKTILGVVRFKTVDGVAKRSYTIFDNEDTAEILKKIEALDADKTGKSADEKVSVQVVEVDGVITAVNVTTSDIASAKLLGTTADTAGTDTAFARIAKEAEERATAITNAIAALDSTVAATVKDGEQYSVLTGVTQTDGKLTGVAEVKLAAVAKTGSASDVATTAIGGDTTHVAVAGENVSAQITDIAKTLKGVKDSIAEVQANDLKYITHQLSETELTALGDSNVKEAYQIFAYTGTWNSTNNKGTQVGDTIKIYKDSSVKEIYLGSSKDTINTSTGAITKAQTVAEADLSLNYAYMKADGTYGMAKINVANFLRESEFKAGLQVNSGVVSVKVDTTSEGAENFLSVGENGVKISGVQNAINTAIQGLDATVTSTGSDNVTVKVDETDGKVSGVTVSTTGLASEAEVVKSVTVNEVTSTFANNNASLTIKGGNIAVADAYVATQYAEPFETKVGTNHIAAGDTVDAAFKKTENTISVLATEVITNEKVTTAAVSELAKSAGVTNTDGVIKYTPDTNTTYLKTASSVHDATVKLDAAIKTVADNITTLDGAALKSLNGSNAITVSGDTANSKTVSLKLGTGTTGDNALVINADGLYLSNVWDCGEY